jgi:acetoin utilization protein AcuB
MINTRLMHYKENAMLVKDWMTLDPVTVSPNESLLTAKDLMKENKIHCLPVTEQEELLGIMTDHDLEIASAHSAKCLSRCDYIDLLCSVKVGEIMIREPFMIRQSHTVQDAAALMLQHDISRLPVVTDRNVLVGIITDTDIFRAFLSLSGYNETRADFFQSWGAAHSRKRIKERYS